MSDEFLHKREEDVFLEVADYEATVDSQYELTKEAMGRSSGQSLDAYMQAMNDAEEEQSSKLWEGVGWVADKVLTPLTAFGDAVLAPIAHDYQPGEGVWKGMKVSGEAFIKTLIPFYGDEDQPHFARQIIDKWVDPDASELQKTSMAFGLDLLSDPTIFLGPGAMKFVQRFFRAGGSIKKLSKYNKMATPSMASRLGTKFDGAIGTSEEAIINLYADAGEVMTPLGKALQAKARKVDKTGDKKLFSELIDDLDQQDEVKNLANLTDIRESEQFIKEISLKLGTPDGDIVSFDKSIDRNTLAKSIFDNVNPLTNTNFNLLKLTDVETTQKALNIVYNAHKANFTEFLGKLSKGQKQLALEAQSKTIKDLLRTPIKDVGRADMYAMRMTLVSLSDLMVKAAGMSLKGDVLGDVLLRNYQGLMEIMLRKTSGVSRLWGSQMRSLGMTPGKGDIAQTFNIMKKIVTDSVEVDYKHNKLLKTLIRAGNDPNVVIPLMEGRITFAKSTDAFFEIFVNSILSSPLTHAVNLTSTAFRMAMEPLSSVLASAGALATFRFADSAEHFRDVFRMAGGILEGFTEASRLGVKKMTNKRMFGDFNYPVRIGPNADLAKMKYNPAIKASNFGITGITGKLVDLLGFAVRVPGSFLMGEDTFMKMIAYRMKLNTYASKWAREQGSNYAQRKDFYRTFKKHPPLSLNKMAMKDADSVLFHKRLGPKGEAINQALKIVPGVRWMIPFFRTPTNLVHEGVRHTPFGLMYKDMRSKVLTANADGDLVRAKLVMGPMMAGGIMAMMGENITGRIDKKTPTGKFQNDQGRMEHSITFAGKYEFYYGNMEPLRLIFDLFTGLRDISTNADMNDPVEEPIAKAAFNTVIGAFVGAATDNYMLQNVGQIFRIMDAAANGDSEQFLEAMEDAVVSMSTPQAVSQWNKQKAQYFLKADTFIEKFKKRIWGASSDLYYHRNAYGEKIEVPHGMGPPGELLNPIYDNTWEQAFDAYSPFRFRKHTIDPVSQTILDLQVPIMGPIKKIKGIPLESRPDLRDKVNKLAGGIGSDSVKETLRFYINSPNWEILPANIKRKLITNIFSSHRRMATEMVFAESEWLQHQVLMQQIKNANIVRDQAHQIE